VTDGPARRLAEAFGRRGLAAPARLLADAHRPLDPLITDVGAALGPLLNLVGGRRVDDLRGLADRPGGLDRLIEELDRRAAGGARADSR
jgi:hypothetical protein